MDHIVTITLNPALDKSAAVEKLIPDKKLRSSNVRFEPGGGGINVSRALKKLGGKSLAIYTKGGHTGQYFKDLLSEEDIHQFTIDIEDQTRENLMIVETSSDQHYRFGMSGAQLSESEKDKTLDILRNLDPKPAIMVASGSLPPGLPGDFYGELAKIAKEHGAKFILDTSGEALEKGANEGVYLLKPNLGELSRLAGVESVEMDMVEKLARDIIHNGNCEVVVVSLGPGGALLVTEDFKEHIPSPTVHKKSVVGAGDSMVAGLVLSLARGKSLREMVRYGVATGTAATMTAGSELCRKEDADNLYQWILETCPLE
ncbi:MAG: 1-phosphofructokinase family hexose kinase [Candidatus Cyclobacteriaceae bacterium M3_2C_046]